MNRTNRSGILKAGPIGGYNQNGNFLINCRFNKEKLIEKIQLIASKKDDIEVYNLDAIDLIKSKLINKDNIFVNFDPPYVSKGNELYLNFYSYNDHICLANEISNNLKNKKWIITYDDNDLIKQIYNKFNISKFNLRYSAQSKKSVQNY